MTEIVDLDTYRSASPDCEASTSGSDNEKFLVEEGLDLLAAYRAISDKLIRLHIMALVKSLGSKSR